MFYSTYTGINRLYGTNSYTYWDYECYVTDIYNLIILSNFSYGLYLKKKLYRLSCLWLHRESVIYYFTLIITSVICLNSGMLLFVLTVLRIKLIPNILLLPQLHKHSPEQALLLHWVNFDCIVFPFLEMDYIHRCIVRIFLGDNC